MNSTSLYNILLKFYLNKLLYLFLFPKIYCKKKFIIFENFKLKINDRNRYIMDIIFILRIEIIFWLIPNKNRTNNQTCQRINLQECQKPRMQICVTSSTYVPAHKAWMLWDKFEEWNYWRRVSTRRYYLDHESWLTIFKLHYLKRNFWNSLNHHYGLSNDYFEHT